MGLIFKSAIFQNSRNCASFTLKLTLKSAILQYGGQRAKFQLNLTLKFPAMLQYGG